MTHEFKSTSNKRFTAFFFHILTAQYPWVSGVVQHNKSTLAVVFPQVKAWAHLEDEGRHHSMQKEGIN